MKKHFFSPGGILPVFLLSTILSATVAAQQNNQVNTVEEDHYSSTQAIYALTAYRAPMDKSDEKKLFNADWVRGEVYFENGKAYKSDQLQFDIDKNELHFQNNNKVNIFTDPVRWFILSDSSNKKIVFKCDYPAIGLKTEHSFYQVLTTGSNLHLVKYLAEKREESYQYNLSAKISYDISGDLYIYDVQRNKMEFIGRSVSSIKKALPAFASQIGVLLKDKGNKRLSEEEIVVLVNGLNGGSK